VRIDAGCVTPPGPSLGLQGQIAGSSVTLAWQRGAGNVARYVLQAGSATGLSNIATLSLAPGSTTFAAAATPGTYFIRVHAANSCGVGPPSTEVSLVVGSGSELPGPPGTPSAVVTGSNVSLSWTAPALGGAPTAYRLEAGTSPGLANAALVTLGATPAFAVSGVPPGTYYVRVRAMNPAGVGPSSGDATVTVP
jgi:predicted phage tail protein